MITKLEGYKHLSLTRKLKVAKSPKLVYIPLVNQNDTDIELIVKVGDTVLKGQKIGFRRNLFNVAIISSVSGKVLNIEEKRYSNDSLIKTLVIENDFKETTAYYEALDITNYTKADFVELLKDCGIVGLGGSGFPTYVKYDTTKKINTLIVNGIECEPYITADYMLMMTYPEEIIESINAIMSINKIKECIIAIKTKNKALINNFKPFMAKYKNIRFELLPDIYPMGWEKLLVEKVKHVTYESLPIEKNIVVNNVATIYAIYNVLKYRQGVTERIITITGEMIKNPQNVLVKVGSKAIDIINQIEGMKRFKDIFFIAGGPMMGVSLNDSDLVVSPNLNCVLVKRTETEDFITNCMRCGKCVNVCPSHLCPVLIKDYVRNKEMLERSDVNKCIECGLCSYICPAKIDVRQFVRQAKSNVRK